MSVRSFLPRSLLALLLSLSFGCLGQTYRVPSGELERLASLPPKQRGGSVRAVQTIGNERPQNVETVSTVAVARAPTRRAVQVSGGSGGRFRGGRSGGRSGGGGGGGSSAGAAVVAAIAIGAIAVGGAFALAVTEGRRYDGWVSADSRQPLLVRRGDSYQLVPLEELTPEMARGARYGVIDDADAQLTQLRRAPLDRVGFTFSVEAGGGRLLAPPAGSSGGGGVRIGLGAFPHQRFGFLLTTSLFGGNEIGSVFNARIGAEAQVWMVEGGIAHLGAYVEGGRGWALHDTGPDTTQRGAGLYAGGGLLLQLEVTTRLAFTVRGGAWTNGDAILPEMLAGIAIY